VSILLGIGLIEKLGFAVFIAVYWPLLIALGAFFTAFKMALGIADNRSAEREGLELNRLKIRIKLTFVFLLIGGFVLILWLDIPSMLLDFAAQGSEEIRQVIANIKKSID
jgi:hypothetical protein